MRRPAGGAGAVVAAAAIAWALVLAVVAGSLHGGDPRGFFLPGSTFSHPPEMTGAPLQVGPGYDGQFFAALAVDPLLLRPETPTLLDSPGYRAGRIGLPLAAWALVLGHPAAALRAYLALCWLLGLLGVWVAARWLEDEGRSPWGALPLALSAGLVASLVRGLPDAAAASLLLLGLWRESRGRRGAVVLLGAAALVRETSLIGAGALALVRWRQGRLREAVRAAVLPLAVALAWRAWVARRPGFVQGHVPEFGLPFQWLPMKLARPWNLASIAEGAALAALGLAAVALVTLLPRWRRFGPAAWSYAGVVLLMLFLGGSVYEDRWAFARVSCALPMLAVPIAAAEDRPRVARLFRAVPLAYAAAGALAMLSMTRHLSGLVRLIGR